MKTNNEVMSAKNKNIEVQELKKQLQEIQQKLEEIEKESTKEKQGNCLIKSPDPLYNAFCHYISDVDSSFRSDYCYAEVDTEHAMHFANEEQCKRYAEALTTFILLRKQPGSEVATDGIKQYVVVPDYNEASVARYCYVNSKFSIISPCFNSEESARKAIETLGEERILNMFKYFHS